MKRRVDAFRAATGENDLIRIGTDQGRHLLARAINRRPCTLGLTVRARRIGMSIAQPRQHRVYHFGQQRSRRVGIKIKHPPSIPLIPPMATRKNRVMSSPHGTTTRDPSALNVKHRSRRIGHNRLKSGTVQRLGHLGRNFFPRLFHRRPGFTATHDRTLKQGRIYRLNHLPQRDGLGAFRQQIAPCPAPAALDQPGPPQVVENLHEKIARDLFSLRQVLELC